ncbi:MAG TPA: methionine gamma-lyase family protein [Candidatus Borkfalkia avistercoris]|uniref:Methionine gamma-lyase family protein n=1 Tax=Candidatus Borkfalkia avistercoris TaxID=2838504 RepID=A0A9D2D0C4_9FIRM|nr:methionine gamma-lyase family protein [Candidatus Borkfalkia avistercoris]
MIDELIMESEKSLEAQFACAEEIAYYNQSKVLDAFRKNKIALRHFVPSTGYGYGDEGRDTLNTLFADIFGAEAALVSPNIVSGTHALTVGLFGVLQAGDTLFSISGSPYDTLTEVISGKGIGSLADYGVRFKMCELSGGDFDFDKIADGLKDESVKVVFIQRSRGYEWRDALSEEKIARVTAFIRAQGFTGCIFVDNCYGEFVEKTEPTENGADIAVGSLIKNAGGGIAPTGGYIIGKREYIDRIAGRLTAPSVGAEVGSYAFGYQYFYEGVFLAPHVVCQAIKGGLLIGACLEKLGYTTSPAIDVPPYDITRAIRFDTKEQLIGFIQAVQEASPVDSFVTLEPWDMPGYQEQVIMAAGTFVQGSSIELSADAPIKEPYIAYFQGGLTYEHCKYALTKILSKLTKF